MADGETPRHLRERLSAAPAWQLPFQPFEWALEWTVHAFKHWALFEFVDYAGRLAIAVSFVTFLINYNTELDEARKQGQYQAWQVINTAQGKGGSGGRIDALEDLAEEGVSLNWVDLSHAMLPGIRLPGATLEHVQLANSVLDGADLEGAKLSHSNFADADLRGANLTDAELLEAELPDVDLSGATLTRADLRDAVLTRAILRDADLRDAEFIGADLTDADLRGAKMARATLRGAVLAAADLSGVDLREAVLGEVYAMPAGAKHARRGPNWKDVTLQGAKLDGAHFEEVTLAGADLRQATLEGAKLRHANLADAKVSHAGFERADLRAANLDRVVGSEVRFDGAQLGMGRVSVDVDHHFEWGRAGVTLRDVRLSESSFRNASMCGARVSGNLEASHFEGADLRYVDFRGADLRGAFFAGADLRGADLRGAELQNASFDDHVRLDGANVHSVQGGLQPDEWANRGAVEIVSDEQWDAMRPGVICDEDSES